MPPRPLAAGSRSCREGSAHPRKGACLAAPGMAPTQSGWLVGAVRRWLWLRRQELCGDGPCTGRGVLAPLTPLGPCLVSNRALWMVTPRLAKPDALRLSASMRVHGSNQPLHGCPQHAGMVGATQAGRRGAKWLVQWSEKVHAEWNYKEKPLVAHVSELLL